ncbi:MAG TPA: SDR family oxidoreductase [Hyphomicrobiales bacterium]|nr:SDR family oxidoreductase [Hyphomicrobiales bacterium]
MRVIITGAAGGIGRAMCLGLAATGADVTMVDSAAGELGAAAAEAGAVPHAGGILPIVADITREGDVGEIVERTRARFGGIDALVNNAAVGRGSIRADFMTSPIKLWEITPDQWRRIVDVNVNGFFLMTRAVVPSLLQAGWGRIISVTTSLDTMFRSGAAAYGGSKAALEAYTATLAADLAGSGVTANIVVPGGPVNTAMIPAAWAVARDRLIQPAVMVPPLLWLLSHEADAVNGRRFVAAAWDTAATGVEAAVAAGAPAAWPQLGEQAIIPGPAMSAR